MAESAVRWVLAFDGSCGACRRVSEVVFEAAEGKLEVLPLAHAEVRQWRARSQGSSAEWAPTLLRVDSSQVRTWTGPGMVVALVRRLGVRSAVRVLRALGEQHHDSTATESPGSAGLARIGRTQFLRLGAGVTVATGLLVKGVAPAWAQAQDASSAQAWVAANRDRLPVTYEEVAAHPMAYRRAIVQALTPAQRSQLWVEHVRRFRAAHPGLSGEKAAAVNRAEKAAATVSVFEQGPGHTALSDLHRQAVNALGPDQAAVLLSRLGAPATGTARQLPDCECSSLQDLCTGNRNCQPRDDVCTRTEGGCGTFWARICDGLCFD